MGEVQAELISVEHSYRAYWFAVVEPIRPQSTHHSHFKTVKTVKTVNMAALFAIAERWVFLFRSSKIRYLRTAVAGPFREAEPRVPLS